MENDKYIKFVDSLYVGTKANKIKWKYLEDDALTSEIIGANPFSGYYFIDGRQFDYQQSFYTEKDNNIIVFCYSAGLGHSLLIVAGGTMKYSKLLNELDTGSRMIKLLAAIRKQFPNPENVMDAFISEFGS